MKEVYLYLIFHLKLKGRKMFYMVMGLFGRSSRAASGLNKRGAMSNSFFIKK
jgi:hypothetical protein